MDGPGGTMLSEIDQTEKDKHHTISLIGAILKKNRTNNEYNKTETDRHREQTVGHQGSKGWGAGKNR